MYGVPANIDLTFLNGAELVQIALGRYQIQFHFHSGASVTVDGDWNLTDASGIVVDRSYHTTARPPYRLHQLIGQTVVGTVVSAPTSVSLQFADGEVLQLIDSSESYESFQIQPGNIIV